MAMITAVVDLQDSTGASVVVANPDGTRSPLVLKMGAGLAASFAKSGDLAIITIGTDGSAGLTGSSVTLGSQVPPQFQASVGTTVQVHTGGGNVLMGSVGVSVPVGKVVTFDLTINASIILPTPGIILPGYLDSFVVFSSYGSSGPTFVGAGVDMARTIPSSPWVGSCSTTVVSGTTVQLYAVPYSPPAFVSHGTYGGAMASGTTVPNGVGDGSNSLVTNDGGKLYVCTNGGVDATSGGPTGSGAGAIVVGGLTWYYVGLASAGVTTSVTVTLNGIRTG